MRGPAVASPLRALVVGGAALLLAATSGWAAAVRILGPINPAVALSLDPGDPAAIEARAEDLLAGGKGGAYLIDEGRRALEGSPVRPRALRLMAVGEAALNRPDRMRPLLAASERLSRRDAGTQLILIEDAVARGDVRGALDRYDLVLRTTPRLNDLLFPNLGQSAADPAAAPAVGRLFARDPEWLTSLVAWYLDGDGPAGDMAALFPLLPARARAISDGQRAGMVAALASRGDYAAARTLFGRFGGDVRAALRNPSFREPRFPPFDWQLGTDTAVAVEAGTAAEPGLRYLAEPGRGGPLAEQLLFLSPGRYRLSVDSVQAAPAEWTLQCVGGAGGPAATLRVPPDGQARRRETAFVVPSGCAWQRLRGTSGATEGGATDGGGEGRVRRVSVWRAEA